MLKSRAEMKERAEQAPREATEEKRKIVNDGESFARFDADDEQASALVFVFAGEASCFRLTEKLEQLEHGEVTVTSQASVKLPSASFFICERQVFVRLFPHRAV
jgi:hypothetical protein